VKADEIAESNAYSDAFEESFKSSPGKVDPKNNFDTVVEEDDSYPGNSKVGSSAEGSGHFNSRGIEVSGDSQVPSED
jgi:hypothetical protein